MTITPGITTLELLIGNSQIYYGLLILAATIAGLLRGKMESDEARAGNIEFKGKDNTTITDWLEDAGYGLIGGLIGLATMQIIPGIPELLLPTFGYAGRVLLINWGRKAEKTSEDTQK